MITIRFRVLGHEVASWTLDVDIAGDPGDLTPVDYGIKRMSRWWVSRMGK